MTKRNVGGMLLALVASVTAAIASCSFPSYDIVVTGTSGSTGGASATSSSGSVGGGGGNGGASTTSTTSSGTGGSGGSSTSSTSSVSSTSTGGCTTDADGDSYISSKCPGGDDCADEDVLANLMGSFHAFPIQSPPSGTLPFDFNCNGSQETETPMLKCGLDCASEGFKDNVACGDSAPLGKCAGVLGLCAFQATNPAVMKTQRCR